MPQENDSKSDEIVESRNIRNKQKQFIFLAWFIPVFQIEKAMSQLEKEVINNHFINNLYQKK